jgi:hypothetical protein
MKTGQFDDSVYYRVSCGCGSDDHSINIELERDIKIPSMIFMNFYKNIVWCSHWGSLNWFERVYKRIKCSMVMLFTGYVELEECFILSNDNIESFIEALIEGKELLKSDCPHCKDARLKALECCSICGKRVFAEGILDGNS